MARQEHINAILPHAQRAQQVKAPVLWFGWVRAPSRALERRQCTAKHSQLPASGLASNLAALSHPNLARSGAVPEAKVAHCRANWLPK